MTTAASLQISQKMQLLEQTLRMVVCALGLRPRHRASLATQDRGIVLEFACVGGELKTEAGVAEVYVSRLCKTGVSYPGCCLSRACCWCLERGVLRQKGVREMGGWGPRLYDSGTME